MTSPAKMNCRTLAELVTEYLEGSLLDEERASIDAHLAGCEGCTNYLEQMRTTIRLTGALSEEEIPPEVRQSLLGAFRSWRSGI